MNKQCLITSKEFTLGNSGGWKTLLLLDVHAEGRYEANLWGAQPRSQVNSDLHILFRIIKVSGLGSALSETVVTSSVVKKNGFSEDPEIAVYEAAAAGGGFATEPTPVGGPLRRIAVHPQQPVDVPALLRLEYMMGGGEKWALQYQNDGGTASIPASAEFHWTE